MLRLGEVLKRARLQKGFSLDESARATKIRASFLAALESGDYVKLPSSAYAFGFVQNYAEFLGLSKREIVAMFRREFDGEKEENLLPEGLSRKEEFSVRRVKSMRTFIGLGMIVCVVILYILFQYRYAFLDPPLEIKTPKESAVITRGSFDVVGKTEPNSTVTVDETPISIDESGNFKKTVSAFEGKTTVTIKVENNFGRKTVIERHIEVKSQ